MTALRTRFASASFGRLTTARQLGRSQERTSPGPEVLCGEALPEMLADIAVQQRGGQVQKLAVALEAE